MMSSSDIFNRPYNEPSSCSCNCEISSSDATAFGALHHRMLNRNETAKEKEHDDLLASAFKDLSFEERQRHLEILHGVSDGVRENEDLIQTATTEFRMHLSAIKSGTAYEVAEQTEPSYVNNRAFQLIFLRGNEFRAKAAADQAIRFFDIKRKLFGEEKLTQEITMNDLDEDDRDFLKTGTIQLIGKDRTGRVVWFQLPGLRKFKIIENELRVRFYLGMKLLQSEEVQRKGVVSVAYAIGKFRDSMNGAGYVDVVTLMMALPFHHASFHNCMDSPLEKLLGTVALSLIPSSIRSRVRIHLGSHIETQYVLSTYGIPPQLFPFAPMTNELRLDRHLQWYDTELAREMCNEAEFDMIVDGVGRRVKGGADCVDTTMGYPDVTPMSDVKNQDVLYAFGRTVKHEGNQRLRALVKDHSAMYDAGTNGGKRDVVEKIIHDINESGGRFLQLDDASGGCKELPRDRVRSKISQMFRNNRRPKGNSSLRDEDDVRQSPVETSDTLIDKPGPTDVLLGRVGKGKGNDLMLVLVKQHSDQYDSATRGEKARLADSIVQQIKGEGGRFVQPLEEGGWEVLANDLARSKVAKCFRNSRRNKNK